MTESGTQRLASLDALRGFDMLWIMGGNTIIIGLASLLGWGPLNWLAGQMEHVEWHGFAFYDMIFPLFLFMAGVSLPMSMAKRKARGDSQVSIWKHMITRLALLIFLGMLYNGLLRLDAGHIRVASVLARIGIGWFFAAIIVLYSGRIGRAVWFAGILLGYWAIMALIPAPGFTAGDYSWEGNLVGWVDRLLMPGWLYEQGYFDPEGLLSAIPAIGTALLGAITGDFLMNPKLIPSRLKKGLLLTAAGFLALGIAWLWHPVFPVNKKLWTSSFVLYAGGWSLILLSVFYLIIDVWGKKKWAFFFQVIGMNSIVSYLMQSILCVYCVRGFFFEGIISKLPEHWAILVDGISYTGICWLFLYFFYRYKIFLKV
ncbi:MAG: DUF5009 domain-containing protein [Bacteroidales bacterium]